uniref:Uncharacterized protein n=1 Tax=Desertifilum tharense IPPAS B-1220 TaxID=1781255 RepID=A0ACD5H0W8_9CYAN
MVVGTIEAEATVDLEPTHILQSLPIDAINPVTQTPILSTAIVNYVVRSCENVVLNDATEDEPIYSRCLYFSLATQIHPLYSPA